MNKNLIRNTTREIKTSFGRFLAIFAIIVLGVGLFAGLNICRDSMVNTANQYVQTQAMYDFRVISTVGFTESDVAAFANEPYVTAASGANVLDALVSNGDAAEKVIRLHSITENSNKINLLYGQLPSADNECLADSALYSEEDIGKRLYISEGNAEQTLDALRHREYTITGIIESPYYLNKERGISDIGSGRVSAFIVVPQSGFQLDYYHEIFLTVDSGADIYSDAYTEYIDKCTEDVERLAAWSADMRYIEIMEELKVGLLAAGVDPSQADYAMTVPAEPGTFVLSRKANAGYVCFENDVSIVAGIAKVFPLFFFLVAALVCATTMSRMIDEQRTQIGIFKSMGYKNSSILAKYFFYSGSAGIAGCLAGYFGGTKLLPWVIGQAYSMSYSFVARATFVFSPLLLVVSLAITLLCTVGVTWFCCKSELRNAAATLIRPKAPKTGKRILLERIPFLWNRMPFLRKVALRNLFRYKRRFFMMVLGIGGCTALLLTGFGIRDSFTGIASLQYNEIQVYDAELHFTGDADADAQASLQEAYPNHAFLFVTLGSAEILHNGAAKSASLIAPAQDSVSGYMNLKHNGADIMFPVLDEIAIDAGLAESLAVSVGDRITVTLSGHDGATLLVSGIYDNYMGYTAVLSAETWSRRFDTCEVNGAYVLLDEAQDAHEAAAAMLQHELVGNVSIMEDAQQRFETTMSSLDYIVYVIILFAGALAFVVLYNLTNINITERLREIATIKVLGFYNNESCTYVFRENNIPAVIGAGVGVILGNLLLSYVISQIKVDAVTFRFQVNMSSYVFSVALTLVFSFLLQLMMRRKLARIHMAESLKSVE